MRRHDAQSRGISGRAAAFARCRALPFACLPLACLLLSACGSGFFGESDDGPPLPGERIPVLVYDKTIEPDSSIADEPIVLPPVVANDDWTQPGGNARHALSRLSLPSQLQVAWQADIGTGSDDDAQLLAQPIVDNGVVYTMDAMSRVSAFDGATGRRLWDLDLGDKVADSGAFGGGLAIGDGRLYATTGFAWVYALNPADGEILWERQAPGPMRGGPTYADGRIFILTVDNHTLAVNAADGRLLWNHIGVEEMASLVGLSSVAVDGNLAIVPYTSGELLGIDIATGEELWQESLAALTVLDPLADIPQIKGLPVLDNEQIFAISHAGRMVGLDLQQGIRLWDIDLGGIQTPWLAGDFLFVVSNDAQLVCLRRRDGRIRWVQALERYNDPEDKEEPILWFGPLLVGDRLIAANSNKQLVSFAPETGELLSTVDLPGSPAVSPAVAGETLYISTTGGKLLALR